MSWNGSFLAPTFKRAHVIVSSDINAENRIEFNSEQVDFILIRQAKAIVCEHNSSSCRRQTKFVASFLFFLTVATSDK